MHVAANKIQSMLSECYISSEIQVTARVGDKDVPINLSVKVFTHSCLNLVLTCLCVVCSHSPTSFHSCRVSKIDGNM